MLYNSVEVEAVKLSVVNIKNKELLTKDILIKSIVCLKENYVMHHEKQFLYKAMWYIYAYIELGFSYSDGRPVFEEVMQLLGIDSLYVEKQINCKIIKVNKTNIRNLLGRWNPMLHSMKIEEAVNDIINKISKVQIGEYIYHCGKIVEENEDRVLWEHTFKLYVEKSQIFLHDINKNQYYFFEEK